MSRVLTFAGISMALAAMLFVSVDTALAQGRGGGGRGGFGNVMNGKLTLLGDSEIADKLEIVEEQQDQLDELQGEMRDMFRESFSGMREKFGSLSGEEREAMMTEIREGIEEKMEGIEEKLNEILLPFQVERLDQIALQSRIQRGGGMASLLEDDGFIESAGLSEGDVDALKEKAEEVREWVAEENKRIKDEAQEKLLSVLSSEQREKILEMIGEPHEFSRNRGGFDRNRRGGGGDRGGRGGDRRGDRRGGGDRD
jgi:Spy/CpxP family protein refolding chaperone